MNRDKLPESHACGHCGRVAKFSAWAYAHWNEQIVHTCECGARSTLLRGVPVSLNPPSAFHLAGGLDLDTYGERYGIGRFLSVPYKTGETPETDADYRARILAEVSTNYPSPILKG